MIYVGHWKRALEKMDMTMDHPGATGAPGNEPINEPMLQFFAYEHLPEHLQDISRPFGQLAKYIVKTQPRNPERTMGLRKLLEAKDCIVRAALYKD